MAEIQEKFDFGMNTLKVFYFFIIVFSLRGASLAAASECQRISWNSLQSVSKTLSLENKSIQSQKPKHETLEAVRDRARHFTQEARLKEGIFPLEVLDFLESLPSMSESDYWSIFSPFLKDYRHLPKHRSVLQRGIPARRFADLVISTWAERYIFQVHPEEFGMETYAKYWEKVQNLGLRNDVVFSFQQAQELFKKLQLWVRDLNERGGGGRNLQHSLILYGSSVNARLHSKSDIDAALFYRLESGVSKKWRALDEEIPWSRIIGQGILGDSELARMFEIRASGNDSFEHPDQVIQFATKYHPVVIEIQATRVILHLRHSLHELRMF